MVYELIDHRVALIGDPLFPGNAVIDILRETGIGMEIISDVDDIFFKLKRGNIGLILIDIVTINPTTQDLIERLQGYVQEMPVIVMSAESTYRQLKSTLRFKEFYYLNKPYQNDEFLILVRRLLSTWALKSAAMKMQERLQLLEAEIDIYARAGHLLTQRQPIDEKLKGLFESIRGIVPSQAWNGVLIEPDTGEMVFNIVTGNIMGEDAPRFSKGQGILGKTVATMSAIFMEDVRDDEDFDPALDAILGLRVRSMLCVPLIYSGQVVAILQLVNRTDDSVYSDTDIELISPFADCAALAIANARLKTQIEEMSTTDHLTGLYNTKYLDAMMDREIKRGERFGTPMCLLIIDIDSYYDMCEKLGRDAGGELVKEVSQVLSSNITPVDTLSRYAADRFAALLPNITSEEGNVVAGKLRQSIQKHKFLSVSNSGEDVTVSIGLAAYPEHADQKEELVSLAHKALAQAKGEGKNRVEVAAKSKV